MVVGNPLYSSIGRIVDHTGTRSCVILPRYFSVKGRRPTAIFTHMASVSSSPSKQRSANAVPHFIVIETRERHK